jgi:arylsulfatase A-like enzyme
MRSTFALALLLVSTVSAPAADKRPNVLFVFTDDQRFDTIRALGNPEIDTLTLDALVNRGFTFTNAYCQGGLFPAVCLPSRTQLFTGRSVFRTPDPKAKKFDGPTLGSTFKSAGYATLCVTKPGNSFVPGHTAFETVVNIPHVGAATNHRCCTAVIDWLKTAPADKPFFVYLAPSMPHDPRTAEPEFHKRYDPSKLTLAKNFLDRHPFDNGALNIRDEKLASVPRDPAEMRRHLADYYACITSLDFHLGEVLDALRADGRFDDTLVVFTSDQGLAVGGRHGLMGKQNLYEHFKSPLVVAGPGVKPGRSDALVYLWDLPPTVCALTGVPAPKAWEGKSLVPVMEGKSKAVRDALFAVYTDTQRMARDARWKLLWYPKVGRFQLFDLNDDPDEVTDLSGKPEHAAKLAEMKTLLAKLQDEFADKAPRPE